MREGMELAYCDGVDVFPHLNKRSILQQQKFAGITCYDANEIDCLSYFWNSQNFEE